MEPKFQTSFIPKAPINLSSSVAARSFPGGPARPISFIPLVATIVFILSMAVSGGIFAYEKLLTSQIDEASKTLVLAKASFDPETLSTILTASGKLASVRSLLNKHVAVSGLFAALQQNLLPKVSLVTFTVAIDSAGNAVKFSAGGVAQSYAVAAEQSTLLTSMSFVTGQNFSVQDLTDKGNVNIKFEGVVDRSLISYEHALNI